MREQPDLLAAAVQMQQLANPHLGTPAGDGFTQEQHALLRKTGTRREDYETVVLLIPDVPPALLGIPGAASQASIVDRACPMFPGGDILLPDGSTISRDAKLPWQESVLDWSDRHRRIL